MLIRCALVCAGATRPKIARDMLTRLRTDLQILNEDATSGFVGSMRVLDSALVNDLAAQTERACDAQARQRA